MKSPQECPDLVPNWQRGRGAVHQAVVARLLASGLREAGFREDVEAAVGATMDTRQQMIPDAFGVFSATREIHIHEVEVWHQNDDDKERKITAWAKWLLGHGWTLRLFLHDKRGARAEFNPFTHDPAQSELDRVVALLDGPPSVIWVAPELPRSDPKRMPRARVAAPAPVRVARPRGSWVWRGKIRRA